MDQRLHLLETFAARGSDGATYKVCGYEHLARDASAPSADRWEPTGVAEYKLDDGRHVDVADDGSMRIAGSAVTLVPAAHARP